MRREDKINRELESVLPDVFLQTCKKIEANQEEYSHEMNLEVIESIRAVIDQVCHLQKDRKKGKIKYILFSHLHSGLLLQQKQIRIDMMDERFYLDSAETAVYLDFSGVYQYFEEDIQRIKREVIKSVPRMREYEVDIIRYVYAGYYHRIAKQYLTNLLEGINLLTLCSDIKMESAVYVLFGEYMGEADELFVLKGGRQE